MTDTTDFPDLPGHPEHTTVWTESEKRVIAEYAEWCVEADRASRAGQPTDEAIAECLRLTMPLTKCTAGYLAFARTVLDRFSLAGIPAAPADDVRAALLVEIVEAARLALSAQQDGKKT